MDERLKGLFDDKKLTKLKNARILLVGVGGVGSFTLEVLVRSGVTNITIIDFDTYELSNLNRQLHSNQNVLGYKKVEVLKKAMLAINPNLNLIVKDEFLNSESNLNFYDYDYIIDACDSVNTKVYLIDSAFKANIPIISAMGIGNRCNPGLIKVTTLNKTQNDPLAKKMRYFLKDKPYKNKLKVVFSEELPVKSAKIFSYIGVTSVAGILLADTVIKDVINEEVRRN